MAELGSPLPEWPDGSRPAEDHPERTLPVGINSQDLFLDVLVEVANSLGLCVFDDQAARLYLPFGYVLTWDGLIRLAVAPPKLGVAQLDEVMSSCERAWAPRFAERGYCFLRKPYDDNVRAHVLLAERPVPAGKQTVEIRFMADAKAELLSTYVYAHTLLDLPATALAAAQGINRVQVRGKELRGMSAFMVISNRFTDWGPIGGTLRSQVHVDRLVDGLFEYYDQELGPTLNAMRETSGVMRLLLGEEDAPGELLNSRGALALAWTSGDAVLERLFTSIRQRDPDWIEYTGQAVYEALRKLAR
jgi:hypothetical protein